ncbi:hypothetical protein [Corynebacterium terpenotabidum]|uniref:Uncharacterized protein n=1 Tax=Corynebacterium terpenotabidum Y-11 TaxID=1200352 RepID=S4XGM4_9CORY|nr:hypothetical protein [Corynebacterium terpenotabidum]AGP29808.1 hypothetical protein A606_00765 [Corynebacterium terpenotabidum Y-11]
MNPVVSPDTDPDHRYLTLPTGTRRTSVWFGVLGAALLMLCLPFALPVDRDVVDGDYDSLDDAAYETILTWGTWSPDLTAWDAWCSAPRLQPGMTSLYAECSDGSMIDLVGTESVGDGTASMVTAADRAVRAAWMQDQDPMNFQEQDVSGIFHPDLASSIDHVLVSDVFRYYLEDEGSADDENWSDLWGGAPGAEVQDVAVRPVASTPTDLRPVAQDGSFQVRAAAFVHNGTMYTLVASSPNSADDMLFSLLGDLR